MTQDLTDQRFVDVLKELRGSSDEPVLDELGEAIAELADACVATAKRGTLTLTIEFAPRGKGYRGVESFDVQAKVASKPPKGEAVATVLFVGKLPGVLTRRDPQQPELPLRQVADPFPRVDPETGEVLEEARA